MLQVIINGLLQGVLLGLVGLAFALVYRTARVFHVSLGAAYVLAPYMLLASIQSGLPMFVGVILALALPALAGLLAEESIHWPLARKRAPDAVHLIGALGGYLALVQVIVLVWGNETQMLRQGVDQTWIFAGVTLAHAQVLGPAAGVVLIVGFSFWLRRSNQGTEFRAMADNPVLVSLLGRDIRALRRWVFALGGLIAGVAALGSAWDVGFEPHGGLKVVLMGMVASVIGGNRSFLAPVVGGVLLGVLRALVVWFGSARWEDAATFALLVLFLVLRPGGLFSVVQRLEQKA